MRKTIAHIALIILFMVPALTLVSDTLRTQDEKITTDTQSPFTGDLEDQQDDARDSEGDEDSDIVLEKFHLFPIPLNFKEIQLCREHLLIEHEHEVGTPPPKNS